MQAELETAIVEFKEQLAVVSGVLLENSHDEEAQQIHAELAEALAAAEAALASHFTANSTSPGAAAEHFASEDRHEQSVQEETGHHSNTGVSTAAANAAAPRTAAVAAAALKVPEGRTVRRMHPANTYHNQEPDFALLAELHPPFAPFVKVSAATGRASIDFTSWAATKQLTAALLAVDFGIQWTLPEGQLVPPVPNRANYIHWLHDLLQLSSPSGPSVRGLDIGCGANLIYCLLGAALYGWHMTGVDVTKVALDGAAALTQANPHLKQLLEVRRSRCTVGQLPQQQQQQQDTDAAAGNAVLGPLLGALADDHETFSFCMCNPPFFASFEEANQNPHTACGGTHEEMVVAGGELAFIRAMIADSQQLRGRIHWYSSMCGKKASLKILRQELHHAGVTALRTTELAQGKTSRWAVAWSFAASPNTANMPLPRRAFPQLQPHSHQQQQQQRSAEGLAKARRSATTATAPSVTKLSFRVTAAAGEGRKLLQSIAALLGAVAQARQVQVDSTAWRVSCKLALASTSQQEQLPQTQRQQQQQQQGFPSKRLRTGSDSSVCCTDFASQSSEVPVEVSVYQQQRGCFDVVAVVQEQLAQTQQGGDIGGTTFVSAFEVLREDLALMWPVGALQLL